MPVPLLAHALPKSVGAVPLTLILTGLLAAFLAVNAVGTRRAAGRIGGGAHPTGTIDGLSIPWASLPLSKASLASTGNVIGLVLLVLTVVLSAFGPTDPATNLTDIAVLTLGWGFVALTSLLAGGWWPVIDPVAASSRTLRTLAGDTPAETPLPQPTSTVAMVVLMVLWAHLQLLTNLTPLAFTVIVVVYVAGHVLATARFGPAWLTRTESVTVMSRTLGLLRPGDGGPTARLTAVDDTDPLRWTSAIIIGWSLVDLVLETDWWHDLAISQSARETLGPVVLVGVIVVLYGAIRGSSGRGHLGPAFVAVAGGWVVSHYLSILLIEGQGIPIWLSDPFGTGADYLGQRGDLVNLEPLPVAVITVLQIVPFLAGHVLGVVVAQRRAADVVRTEGQLGAVTLFARAVIAVLLLGGAWMQLGGL